MERDSPPKILRIRNDLTLNRDQKIDAVLAWLVERGTELPKQYWQLEISLADQPLELSKPLLFRTEFAAVAALARFCRTGDDDTETRLVTYEPESFRAMVARAYLD